MGGTGKANKDESKANKETSLASDELIGRRVDILAEHYQMGVTEVQNLIALYNSSVKGEDGPRKLTQIRGGESESEEVKRKAVKEGLLRLCRADAVEEPLDEQDLEAETDMEVLRREARFRGIGMEDMGLDTSAWVAKLKAEEMVEENEYVIKAILDKKEDGGVWYWKVDWEDSDGATTWEEKANIEGSPMFEDFEKAWVLKQKATPPKGKKKVMRRGKAADGGAGIAGAETAGAGGSAGTGGSGGGFTEQQMQILTGVSRGGDPPRRPSWSWRSCRRRPRRGRRPSAVTCRCGRVPLPPRSPLLLLLPHHQHHQHHHHHYHYPWYHYHRRPRRCSCCLRCSCCSCRCSQGPRAPGPWRSTGWP